MEKLGNSLTGDGRDPRHVPVQLALDPPSGLIGAGDVHLGDDQQLGPLGQGLAVLSQLVPDGLVIVERVGTIQRHRLHEVHEEIGPLDVTEELVAQSVTGVCPLDQTGNIGHDEILVFRDHGSQVGVLGRERIVGDLGMCAGDAGQQGGFARVGQSDQTDVGDDLQLQDDPVLFAGMSLLALSRSPVGRRLEVSVAVTSTATPPHDHFIARSLEVAEYVTTVAVADQGSRGDFDHEILAPATESIGTLAVVAPRRPPVPLMGKVRKVGVTLCRPDHHVTASAAVAAIRPAPRRILLPTEAHAAVASGSPANINGHSVDEHAVSSGAAGR